MESLGIMSFSSRLLEGAIKFVGERPGALLRSPRRLSALDAECAVYSTASGYLERVLWNVPEPVGGGITGIDMAGTGSHSDPETARLISICEAIERYSNCAVPRNLVQASAVELEPHVVDYRQFPVCSTEEMMSPSCSFVHFSPNRSVRWAKGVDAYNNDEVYVPAQMVWLHYPYGGSEGMFATQVSTGSAAHSDLDSALFAGLSEVLERDLISAVWLKRLPLKNIIIPWENFPLLRRLCAGVCVSPEANIRFLDGTTEFGLPIVYAYYSNPADVSLANVVMCATAKTYSAAIEKVLRELSASLIGLRSRIDSGDGSAGNMVFDGALEMAALDNAAAFDFLRKDNGTLGLVELDKTVDTSLSWANLVNRLNEAGHSVYYVDISTPESRAFGLCVVKVIVPSLMPLSFDRFMQFTDHPRLRDLADFFGAYSIDDINKLPQPFA